MCFAANEIVGITNETFHEKDDFQRYASWDYCYGLAQCMYSRKDALEDYDYDLMALSLSNYLFSWGMGRNKFLMERSYKIHIEPLKILFEEEGLWDGSMNGEGLAAFKTTLLNGYNGLQRMSDVLFTKILLGLTGNIIAFDSNCTKALGRLGFGNSFLHPDVNGETSWDRFKQSDDFAFIVQSLKESCLGNANYPGVKYIDGRYVQTDERRYYPPAKLVDMFLFNLGVKIKSGDPDIIQRLENQMI